MERRKMLLRDVEHNTCKPLSEILKMDDQVVVEDYGTQALYGGGYLDHLYRIKGTDDLIRIRHYEGEEPGEDEVIFEEGFFKIRREFANKVGDLSREFLIPFRVSLAIGVKRENYEAFKEAIRDADSWSVETLRDLRAGITRRKAALQAILGQDLYDSLDIENMGQDHSERIAHFVWDRAMARINS